MLCNIKCVDEQNSKCFISDCENRVEYKVWLEIACCTASVCGKHLEQFVNDVNTEYDELKEILEDEQKLKDKKEKYNNKNK